MNEARVLSRMLIVGDIGPTTPLCVLLEVAKAHRVTANNDLVSAIKGKKVPTVRLPYNNRDIKRIAAFVNKSHKWTVSSLMDAYTFLMRFTEPDYLDTVSVDDYPIGEQTPMNPRSLNCTCLYALCRRRRLRVNRLTTSDGMVRLLRVYTIPLDRMRASLLKAAERVQDKSDIVNALATFNYLSEIDEPLEEVEVVTYSVIEAMNKEHFSLSPFTSSLKPVVLPDVYNRLDKLGRQLQESDEYPDNPDEVEAIAIACVKHGIDISSSLHPIRELESIETGDRYKPYCYLMSARIMDPHRSPYLNVCFNPLLPPAMYTMKQLRRHCLNEGYDERELAMTHPYTLMQTASICSTFYHGKSRDTIQEHTVVMFEDLSTLEHSEAVSYGLFGEPKYVFTYRELATTFNTYKYFKNPIEEAPEACYTPSVINKLERLSSIPRRPHESDQSYMDRTDLSMYIAGVKGIISGMSEGEIALRAMYENGIADTRESIARIMKTLLDLSMMMRGWDGNGELPISLALVDCQADVDVRVTNGISNMKTLTDCPTGRVIMSLPLVRYNNSNGEYQKSHDPSIGLTINEKIEIVMRGDSVYSCIRSSSNWLATTVHKYMEYLKMELPFDITRLASIS